MALIVQKYGGTSMGSVERIQHVAAKVAGFIARGDQVVVVVSEMSGETDRLTKLAKEINPRGSAREFDQILATGEQVTALHIPPGQLIGIASAIGRDTYPATAMTAS